MPAPVLPPNVLPPVATAALTTPPPMDAATRSKAGLVTVVLAGNPNVGKSVVFNALTGLYANVSNFPGTTVDTPHGRCKHNDRIFIQDTPGVYGLSGLSDEETITEAAVLDADIVVNVVNATTLSRDLFFTQQLIDYGCTVLVVVNQMDRLANTQQQLDVERLETLLGVTVLPLVATHAHGVTPLITLLNQLPLEANAITQAGNPCPGMVPGQPARNAEANPAQRMHAYGLRRKHINAVVANTLTQTTPSTTTPTSQTLSQRLGTWCLNPLIGGVSLLGVLWLLYQVVGVWVAGDLVNFTEGTIMLGWVIPPIQWAVGQVFATDSWMYKLLAGEFGVLTMSIQYIYGVLFPLVLGFYVYLSVLEDSGYLPRIAVLSDTILSRIGLNGRAIIPMILGFGCVTMATVSTRVLTSQRERTIASTLLAVTIPCSAQLAVIMALMAAAGGFKAWGVYLVILSALFCAIGAALNLVLPGKSTPLVLDLPPMRLPQLTNVAQKTWVRTKAFIAEAAPLFVLGSAIVGVLHVFGALTVIQHWLSPLTEQWLLLPGETATAFVMGLVRRDFGAAGLLAMGDTLTAAQVMTALVTITLFVPCIASAAIFWKERGPGEATAILLGSWAIAFGMGAIVARILAWVPIL